MIAIQKIGKSFMGALQYNLKKMNLPDRSHRAEILASNFTNMNIGQIKREIDMVRSLRPNLNRYAYRFIGLGIFNLATSGSTDKSHFILSIGVNVQLLPLSELIATSEVLVATLNSSSNSTIIVSGTTLYSVSPYFSI